MTDILDLIRTDIRKTQAYSVADAVGMIKLDAMENPYAFPEALRADLARHLFEGEDPVMARLNRYPVPSYRALKEAIARVEGIDERHGLLLGNGSDEIIAMLSLLLSHPDRRNAPILTPAPSFVMYAISASLCHLPVVEVPLNAAFGLDVAAMCEAIATHKPALIYLAYPNNPTGQLYGEDEIRAILQAASASPQPSIVVVDEAYHPFAKCTWMQALAEFEHLLVLRTFSKLGLAGLRLGYIAGAPALINELDKVRPPYNINALTEAVALFALNHMDAFNEQAASILAQREQLMHSLSEFKQMTVYSSAANFILLRLDPALEAAAVWQAMKAQGVLIKNLSPSHPMLKGCLRITVGTPEENVALLRAIRAAGVV